MNNEIEISMLDFTNMSSEDTHVLINVNIGAMPPKRAYDYLVNIKTTLPLCKMLNERGITYSLIGCRSDGAGNIVTSIESNDNIVDTENTKFDDAMNIV